MNKKRKTELEGKFVRMIEERMERFDYSTEEEIINYTIDVINLLYSKDLIKKGEKIRLEKSRQTDEFNITINPGEEFSNDILYAIKSIAEKDNIKVSNGEVKCKCCKTTWKNVAKFWKKVPYVTASYDSNRMREMWYLEIDTVFHK